MKFSVVSKLVTECGEKLQCPETQILSDFAKNTQKPRRHQKTQIYWKNPKKPFMGSTLNQWQIVHSISQEVIELESRNLVCELIIDMHRSFNTDKHFLR